MPVTINTILILTSDGNPHIRDSGVSREVLTRLEGCMTPFLGCMTPMREPNEMRP
jgi:hypothetical protein